jgi:hypothetical protein
MPAQESADLGIRRQNNGQWSVRGLPHLGSGRLARQICPSQIKENGRKTKQKSLDFLGFIRPIRGFSKGYSDSKSKIFFSPLFRLARAAPPDRMGARVQVDGARTGW